MDSEMDSYEFGHIHCCKKGFQTKKQKTTRAVRESDYSPAAALSDYSVEIF